MFTSTLAPSHRRFLFIATAALSALSLAACKDSTSRAASVASTLSISSGDAQTITVNQSPAAPLTVKVLDQYGAAMSGAVVNWAIASGGGTLNAGTSVTDASGQAQITYVAGTAAGPASVTASIGELPVLTFNLTLSPDVPASLSEVSGDAQSAIVGEAAPQPLVVLVADQFGNAVPGVTVNWASNDGDALASASSLTDAAGHASMTLTLSGSSGARTITASVNGLTSSVAFTVTGS